MFKFSNFSYYRSIIFLTCSLIWLLFSGSGSFAQTYENGDRLIHTPTSNITALSADVFGDNMDMATGSVSFYTVDVSIPGNSKLPVQVGRRFEKVMDDNKTWVIDAPRLDNVTYCNWFEPQVTGHAYYDGYNNWTTEGDEDGPTKEWAARGGLTLSVPNHSKNQFLSSFKTKDFWTTECLSHPTDLYSLVTAPNGDKYYFDIESGDTSAQYYGDPALQEFGLMQLYASKIEDVHGNWVKYDYIKDDDNNVTGVSRIHSSDGREILISQNTAGYIDTITANNRDWTYAYAGDGQLNRVTLPDGRYWDYSDMSVFKREDPFNNQNDVGSTFFPVIIRHPSGATMAYTIQGIRNGFHKSTCTYPHYVAPYGTSFISYAVKRKTLTVGSDSYAWDFEYEQDFGSCSSPISSTKYRKVTSPDGSLKIIQVYRGATYLENRSYKKGRIIKEETFSNSDQKLRTVTNEFVEGPGLGSTGTANANRQAYLKKRVTNQDEDSFTTKLEYDLDLNSPDFSYGLPLEKTKYSSVSELARVTSTTYEHNLSKWILGLPKTVSETSTTGITREVAGYTYDAFGQTVSQTRYGQPRVSYTYHSGGVQAGNVASITDALNRRAEAHDWHRGMPRLVKRAVGTGDEIETRQTVDDNGWVTSQTDAKGQTTSYVRDIMGRLETITPPGNWDHTSVEYDFSGGGAVQTITKGQSKTTITYDAMFRPVLEHSQALDTGWSSYVNTKYDGLGRVIFQSQPSDNPSESKGVDTTYDGLGRVYDVTETVAPYAKTQHRYYGDHRYRIVDPSGAYLQYYDTGYSGPGGKDHRLIRKYGADNALLQETIPHQNEWGQLTRLQQKGSIGGHNVDHSQYFEYDVNQRLCRHYVPERGHKVYRYDAAGQLLDYSQEAGIGSQCGSMTPGNRTTNYYDNLGRIFYVDFWTNGTLDLIKEYDPNGNLTGILRGLGSQAWGPDRSLWSYEYNELNMLTKESLFITDDGGFIDGKVFNTIYDHDTSGNLIQKILPNNQVVDYTVDGLGRMKSVTASGTSLATGTVYHPSGAVDQMSYGNGHDFTQMFNARLLPSQLRTTNGSVTPIDQTFTYTAKGQIETITDQAVTGNNRSYAYDGMGQLVSASGPWGAGSYDYDSLGNLRSKQLGTRTVALSYDETLNRLSQSVDSGASGTRAVGYDYRGNVTTLGGTSFTYGLTNQPLSVSGTVNGTYLYDGHDKRVKSVVNGQTIYNVYDASGSLIHIEAGDDPDTQAVDPKTTTYVTGPMGTLARISSVNDGPDEVTYLHSNQLGSAQAGTDAHGALDWREQYTPFGETLQNPAANDNLGGFTGHIKDKKLGLNYMQARYYDPVIGRFLSIDPVTFLDNGNPGYFNRYSYTMNDPINATDPDGRQSCGYACRMVQRELRRTNNHREARRGAAQALDIATDVAPGISDAKDIHNAVVNPSLGSIGTAIVGLVPGIGEVKGLFKGGKTAISMDEALDAADTFLDLGTDIKSIDGASGVQFIQQGTDAAGDVVTKRVGFDVNPSSSHVQRIGPHLNLQTRRNGSIIKTGPEADPHIPIDPTTVKPGDY